MTRTEKLGEGAKGNDLLDGRRKGGQGKVTVTEQAGEEENSYFYKVEVAMRAVLNLVFKRCAGKLDPFIASWAKPANYPGF